MKYIPNRGEIYLILSIESSSPQIFQIGVQDIGIGSDPESAEYI
ncbi:hypothetical protein [Priestia endophytica]